MPEIVIYTKKFCAYCTWAKQLLADKNATWTEINVTGDRDKMARMVERAGGRMTAPQIFIDNRHVGGFDDLHALDSRGELEPMLRAAITPAGDPRALPTVNGPARLGDDETGESDTDPAATEPTDDDAAATATDEPQRRVIILGSGCAGLTAAIYAARANLEPLLITGTEFGGQLYTTTDVENFPGFPEGIQGPELIERMKAQAERFGTELVRGEATALELDERPFTVVVDNKKRYRCDAVIVATGASPKEIGVPNELELRGYGVSTCATCDGAFFRDRPIAVVGGGDSAMEEALFLTHFASQVTLIHRRDELRASQIMQDRLLAHDKIDVAWNTEVVAFEGEAPTGLTGVRVKNNQTNEESVLEVEGCFIAIGHNPNSDLLHASSVKLDDLGYVTGEHLPRTPIEGLFVAGDVHDHHYRQAITAAGYGCRAALDAEKWLGSNH